MPISLLFGLGLLIFGSGPLLAFAVADYLGLITDPNPNPIGLGLLFVVTILPAIALTLFGLLQMAWKWARQ